MFRKDETDVDLPRSALRVWLAGRVVAILEEFI